VALTLQHILDAAYPAYAAAHRLPVRIHRAVSALRRCRTGALGTHAVVCRAGHVVAVRANSCRHRACPQCGWRKAAAWLEQWATRLLPTAHFHVIFTLPPVLHTLWRWNRRRFAAAFFRAASDALLQLLEQERHLGARPGLLMGLHTWGSALPLHPHLHCLVTAGGVQPDGHWRSSRPDFLLWAPILREVYRAKLVEALEALLAAGKLAWPPDLDELAVRALLHDAQQLTWHVRIEPPYAHGRGLVVYLARYLRGGPIKNYRLVDCAAGRVGFRYREHRSAGRPKWRTLTLPVEEFLTRLFEHVPPSGLHLVRAYGVYARRERAARESCRSQLQPRWQQPLPPRPPAAATDTERCPRCGAPLRTIVCVPRTARQADEKPTGPGPPLPSMFN
jgi:hypothetical protein